MMKSILEVKEGLRADLIRVFSTACLPFALYFLYLDMQYRDATLSHPLSYGDLLAHASDFIAIAFTVFICSAAVLFGPVLARKRLTFAFSKQIKQLSGKLKSARADTLFHAMYIQRYKQMSKIIADTMEYVEQFAGTISLEVQQDLMTAIKELAEDLSKGLCSNLQKETLNVKKTLEQTQNHFTDYIHNHNIRLEIICPEELTVVADSLFMRLIFLNILGLPICSTQTNGTISVVVTQKNGHAHVEIQDNRYVLTAEGNEHLKFPREFLAKDNELRQLCIQNGWGYEFREQKKGEFYRKVSIPLEDYDTVENNVVSFTSLH